MDKDKLTKEVLSNLLETATYESPWLGFQFDKTQVPEVEGEFRCDTAARILLAGGVVEFIDYWAENTDDIYAENGYFESDAGIYPVVLKDIVKGLEKAESGDWNAYDEQTRELVMEDVAELLQDPEDACFDNDEAERVMQVILFNETIY